LTAVIKLEHDSSMSVKVFYMMSMNKKYVLVHFVIKPFKTYYTMF